MVNPALLIVGLAPGDIVMDKHQFTTIFSFR
jgi:hypothetical protein